MPGAARADCDVGENGVPQETLLSSMGPHWANLGGLRPMLAKSGTSVGATFIGEVLGNLSGGIKQGSHYDGLLDIYMDVDFEKVVGWKGLEWTAFFPRHNSRVTYVVWDPPHRRVLVNPRADCGACPRYQLQRSLSGQLNC